MFSATRLISLVSLALAACASPIVTIRDNGIKVPLTKHVNVTSGHDLLKSDRARVQRLRAGRSKSVPSREHASADLSSPVTNAGVIYTAALEVGSPSTTCIAHFALNLRTSLTVSPDNLIVDTGSSNTWVGASTAYTATSTSEDTGGFLVSVSHACSISAQPDSDDEL